MARLNATSPPVATGSNHSQDEEEAVEEDSFRKFVYAERIIADSAIAEEYGDTQFSLQIREQLNAEDHPEQDPEDEDEDEDVNENVLNVLNNATSTPHTSNRAPEEDEPRQDPPLSIRKRVTGIFNEGMRLLTSGSRANDNDSTENTSLTEARDDTMQPLSTSTSASKVSKKLNRPSVLHQPLNTYNPQPQSSGKPDVYEVNASPEKTETTPTRTQSKQGQGVKRKRNNPAVAKNPPPRGKAPTTDLPEAASKETEAPTRVTRSRGSGEVVEPIDYSRNVEAVVRRKRRSGTADDEPPSKESRKRNKTFVTKVETDELEDADRPSTPSNQNLADEGIPAASDKGSQSGAASESPDSTARGTKKGRNATGEVKEDSGDQEYQDEGSGVEDAENEEDSEAVSEGMAPTIATNPKRERGGERQVSINSPYFGDNFIADSNIEKITELVDRLEINSAKDLQDNPENLEKAVTVPGKEIQVLTRSIISSYESIQGLDEHDDPDPAARTEALCSAARDLDRLEVIVREIMEKKLCDPAKLAARDKNKTEKWRKRMLEDLFLFIMPDIIRAASAAIFTYGSDGPPSTPDLKEILRYIALVSRLLFIVEDPHNKGLRPKAAHNAKKPIQKPYFSIKPLLRGFEMQCKQELKHREKVAEEKRQAPILERERKEREEADRLAAEQDRMERQKREEVINYQFNLNRMQLGFPPIPLPGGQVPQNLPSSEPPQPSQPTHTQELNITTHRMRAEQEVSDLTKEVDALKKKLEAAERRATKLRREEQRQLKGYDAEETHEADYERVEMFPAGNNHAPAAEPWTKTDYAVLGDGLKVETGPDKYPNIARRLDRSLDEIFEKAMEFKRTMMEGLYKKNGKPVPPWIEIIGNEMPRGRV
ncbi:hypothetical protein ACLOAV_004337 [Pseudogymnoascus australis]